jgi:hypothetical protein
MSLFRANIFANSIIIGLSINLINCYGILAQSLDIEQKSKELDLDKEIIENSPVFQEWLKSVPIVLNKIENKPSFTTRIKLGYAEFPSNHHQGGISVGIEDLFIGKTPLTFNADYNTDFKGDRLSAGADLHYYLLPLGSYINLAPVVGYRYIETEGYHTDGVNVGIRLGLIFSPYGGGDLFVTQSFVSPTNSNEIGITEINAGYAITEKIRLSAEIEWQNSRQKGDSQIGIGLEWIINDDLR